MTTMNILEHSHPLRLIDLQMQHLKEENAEESDDEEEKNVVVQDEFVCTCKRCDQEINVYYRYYYKCVNDSCDYSLHKFCAELPRYLTKHVVHPFPLKQYQNPWVWKCEHCRRTHNPGEVCYYRDSFDSTMWSFSMDLDCAVEVEKRKIQHPSHPHPLVSLTTKPILCECSACGKEHKGVFLQCTTCSNFAIHNDCAFLPKSLLIQQATDNIFHHTHPLTLSYSFIDDEQQAKYYPKCRVCGGNFEFMKLWIYKCEKCIYYAHVDCATSRREPFMSMLSASKGKTVKNFKDADYPDLLNLPFPDITYSIPKHLFFKEINPTTYESDKVILHQINQHELVLVDTKCFDVFGTTSSKMNPLIKCHNEMEKIELLCNGCLRPIMEMPFYKCRGNEDEGCNFVLHEWCTRLPTKVENHPGHPKHTLNFISNASHELPKVFKCQVCFLPCNGFAYGCVRCGYYVDVTCGLMPGNITHKSHPNHLLRISTITHHSYSYKCHLCQQMSQWERFFQGKHLLFNCNICDVYIHPECALLLPETIRHTYDKHPMHLSYHPIENHKSEYFCEICENELDPHSCFYHCNECVQSVHSACAPLILQSETETNSETWWNSMYKFLNVKFGSIHKIRGHPHRLSFVQGMEHDGRCNICREKLQYNMTFKCVKCEFAIDYNCCERLNKKRN